MTSMWCCELELCKSQGLWYERQKRKTHTGHRNVSPNCSGRVEICLFSYQRSCDNTLVFGGRGGIAFSCVSSHLSREEWAEGPVRRGERLWGGSERDQKQQGGTSRSVGGRGVGCESLMGNVPSQPCSPDIEIVLV